MWKTIQFEPNYEVSTRGEVRSVLTGLLKSLRDSAKGYLRVTLYLSGKTYSIHRLVALTHVDGFAEGLVVNHKDGNKKNNRAENLEWCTSKQNFHHAIETGLFVPRDINGLSNPMSKFTKDEITSIKQLSSVGMTVREISKIVGAPYERVRRLLSGQHYKS